MYLLSEDNKAKVFDFCKSLTPGQFFLVSMCAGESIFFCNRTFYNRTSDEAVYLGEISVKDVVSSLEYTFEGHQSKSLESLVENIRRSSMLVRGSQRRLASFVDFVPMPPNAFSGEPRVQVVDEQERLRRRLVIRLEVAQRQAEEAQRQAEEAQRQAEEAQRQAEVAQRQADVLNRRLTAADDRHQADVAEILRLRQMLEPGEEVAGPSNLDTEERE